MSLENVHPPINFSPAYNFFFHPEHVENEWVKAAAIITTIALTVFSAFLWLIPFVCVRIQDAWNFDVEPPETSGPQSQIIQVPFPEYPFQADTQKKILH